MTNNISNNDKRKSTLNKNKNNNIITNKGIKSKRILTWEKKTLDTKNNKKAKINISINSEKFEKLNSTGNYLIKNNYKILSNRAEHAPINNQRKSTLYSCNISSNQTHILKNSLKVPSHTKIENHVNKLTLSNPNL